MLIVVSPDGEEFYSVRLLEKILGINFLTIFCIAGFQRGVRCCRYKGKDYISKKDFLGVLDPHEKGDKELIDKFKMWDSIPLSKKGVKK